MHKLIIFCFYIPLVFSTINMQGFLGTFTSASESQIQLFAYFNVCLTIVGAILLFKKKQALAGPIKVWIFFYLIYYTLAILANITTGNEPFKLLASFVSVAYFICFSILLSIPEYRKPIAKVLTLSFFLTTVFLILFNYYNISLDFKGIAEYKLNRAGGVYGDANNAALSSILSFIFIYYKFIPENKTQRILQKIALVISVYAVLITFSRTGLVVLAVVMGLAFRRKLNFQKVFLFVLLGIPSLFVGLKWLSSSSLLNTVQQDRVRSTIDLFTFQTKQLNYSDRDVLLQKMFSYIQESPFLGNGVQFSNSIRGHNTIIGIWADAGIFPFLIFIFILLYFVKKSLKSEESIKFFSISVLAVLCIFMLSLQTIINQPYLMVVFCLIAYLIDKKKVFKFE